MNMHRAHLAQNHSPESQKDWEQANQDLRTKPKGLKTQMSLGSRSMVWDLKDPRGPKRSGDGHFQIRISKPLWGKEFEIVIIGRKREASGTLYARFGRLPQVMQLAQVFEDDLNRGRIQTRQLQEMDWHAARGKMKRWGEHVIRRATRSRIAIQEK